MNESLLLHLAEMGLLEPVPDVDPWAQLAMYESAELAGRQLVARHGVELDSVVAEETAAYVTQGRQYFESAGEAGINIRPLLLYYGVMSLCRAIVLCASGGAKEFALAKHHGLRAVAWDKGISDGTASLLDLAMTAWPGTFTQLGQVTGNTDHALVHGVYEQRISVRQDGTVPTDDWIKTFSLTIGETLARIPDLQDVYEATLSTRAACHPTYVRWYPGTQVDYVFLPTRLGLPTVPYVREAFRIHADERITENDSHSWLRQVPNVEFHINQNNSPLPLRDYVPPIRNDRRMFPYLVEPIGEDGVLSTLSTLFVLSFGLGSLARYHPLFWKRLTGGATGDHLVPLIHAALETVEWLVPKLVLREIEQAYPGKETYSYPYPY